MDDNGGTLEKEDCRVWSFMVPIEQLFELCKKKKNRKNSYLVVNSKHTDSDVQMVLCGNFVQIWVWDGIVGQIHGF